MTIGILDIIIRIVLVIATSVLFFLIASAYRRMKSTKMLFITAGFGIFWVHALISLPELVNESFDVALNENAHLLFPLVGLMFILVGILKE